MTPIRLGGSLTPVEDVPEEPAGYYYNDVDVPDASNSSLNWRKVVESAQLTGPMKNLAYQAQVLTLESTQVNLRLPVAAFATEKNRLYLEQQLSRYFGRPFYVRFEVGELTSETVGEVVTKEKIQAKLDRIERFKKAPLVKQFMQELGAVVDDNTVKDRH